jgi:uncharacterized protein (DUF2236 family)
MKAERRVDLPGVRRAVTDLSNVITASLETLSPEDTGYFGPGSVAWRIHRDPSFGVGGIAALFVEALHPVAMAAVDQHSDFAHNAWIRTSRTTQYLFTIVYGGKSAADAAAARLRKLHDGIRGIDPVTGRRYRAEDPDLLLWVHAIGVEYSLRAYEAYAHRLSMQDADRFVREMKTSARLVGLDPEIAPGSVAELRSYIDSVSEIQMSDPAYDFFRAFLRARMPLTMRGPWLLHLVGMLALLPREFRRWYDAPRWLPAGRFARAAIRIILRLTNLTYPVLKPIRSARRRLDALEKDALTRRSTR